MPILRTLISILSPAFQLPTQQQLTTTLLETTYENVKKCIDQKVRDAISIRLQCSYRSNARNEGIKIQLIHQHNWISKIIVQLLGAAFLHCLYRLAVVIQLTAFNFKIFC